MIPLTIEENRSYQEQKAFYICKKEFSIDDKDKKYEKFIVIILENIEELLIKFVI